MNVNLTDFIYNRILSIDVGIKHLSLCLIDFHSTIWHYNIQKWDLIALSGKNISDYTRDIVEKLRRYDFGLIDSILIEQQVSRNTQMKTLSHVLQAYFMCELKVTADKIIFVSPKTRFNTNNIHYNELVQRCRKQLNIDEKMSRRDIKKLSIVITKMELKNSDTWLRFFESNKKADDLADSFIQAIAWENNRRSYSLG